MKRDKEAIYVATFGLAMNDPTSVPQKDSEDGPGNFRTLDLNIPATVADVARHLGIEVKSIGIVIVNDELANVNSSVHEGDKIMLYALIGGG